MLSGIQAHILIFLWPYATRLGHFLSTCYCVELICVYLLIWLYWWSFLFVSHLMIYHDSISFAYHFCSYCLCGLFATSCRLSDKRTCLRLSYLRNTWVVLLLLVSTWLLSLCRILGENRRWLVLIDDLGAFRCCWREFILRIYTRDSRASWTTQWAYGRYLLCWCTLFILLEHHLWLVESNLNTVQLILGHSCVLKLWINRILFGTLNWWIGLASIFDCRGLCCYIMSILRFSLL